MKINTAAYNKFTKDIIPKKIKSEGLADKFDINEFISNFDLDTKVATLATKAELEVEHD